MNAPGSQLVRKKHKKMGRKPKYIDWDRVDELLQHQWPISEIASFCGLSEANFHLKARKKYKGNFRDHHESKKAEGIGRLRTKQYQLALDGNVTMLIWLGKQLMGQSDKSEVKNEGKLDIKVTSLLELIKSAPPIILESNYMHNHKQIPETVNNMLDVSTETAYTEGSTKVNPD